jgi:Spy/CpxP family protein refolding chaperone
MRLTYLITPIIAMLACSSLQAQTPEATPSPDSSFSHHGHGRHHHAWIWRKLNLTDTQKQGIKQYRASNKAAFQSALASYLSAKQGVLDAIKNNGSTQAAAATLASAEANLMALRVKQEQYIASLLTGDQVTTWQDFQNKRTTRIQNRINALRQGNS